MGVDRGGEVWTQQGPKLVGGGAVGASSQGDSVALSADGNTAIVGGSGDNPTRGWAGAAWVWTRSSGAWTQQGPKLVGSGAEEYGARQGRSVALSADGGTALVGGPWGHAGVGAVWVWTRSGGVWTQQGPELVGDGAVHQSRQGESVALSADGNTALVGGPGDTSTYPLMDTGAYQGAAWFWTRSGGAWSQQGPKVVARGAVDPSWRLLGSAVALAADGKTAIVGGPLEPWGGPTWPWSSATGAAWIFSTAVDVSAQVSVTVSEFSKGRDRGNPNWTAILTVTNANRPPGRGERAATLPAPVFVVLRDLPANLTVLNSTGVYQGSPYITVSAEPLAAGNSASVTVEFANPAGGPITFMPVPYSSAH